MKIPLSCSFASYLLHESCLGIVGKLFIQKQTKLDEGLADCSPRMHDHRSGAVSRGGGNLNKDYPLYRGT
jgi:hypothetical protein